MDVVLLEKDGKKELKRQKELLLLIFKNGTAKSFVLLVSKS
jgi:hypothetical protein